MASRLLATAGCVLLVVVGLGVSRRETAAPHPVVTIVAPAIPVATTVDWRPWARAVHARDVERARVDAAIEYAVALAHQAEQARRLISHHARTVPIPTSGKNNDYTTWSDWPLGPFAGAFDIARTTWRAYAGVYAQRWPDAGTAPPDAQILGARLVRAAVGSSEWGGLRVCGG